MNGSAAIHDFELALAGKTSEDVAAQLHAGKFGMARETADAFAVAARRRRRERTRPRRARSANTSTTSAARTPTRSLVLAALPGRHPLHGPRRARHRHRPHAPARLRRGARRGVADRLPPPVPRRLDGMAHGVWLNLGSAVRHARSVPQGGRRGRATSATTSTAW